MVKVKIDGSDLMEVHWVRILTREPGSQIKNTSERTVSCYLMKYIGTIIIVGTAGSSSFVRNEKLRDATIP